MATRISDKPVVDRSKYQKMLVFIDKEGYVAVAGKPKGISEEEKAKRQKAREKVKAEAKKQRADGNPEEVEKYNELAKAYELYEQLKVKEGVFDFADLISNTLTLFRTRKNILNSYQEQFKYILVDEFQDTNYAQNQLAILLTGDKKNITV